MAHPVCLSTWLRRRNLVSEAGIEPTTDEAYETSALPLSYSASSLSNSRLWLPLLDSNQALRVQSPVPCQLDEGASTAILRKLARARRLEFASPGLKCSSTAIELRQRWRMVQESNLPDPKVSTR